MCTRIALLVAAAVLQVGCYNYLPIRRSELVPSTYLAVTLTQFGSEDLARYLGPDVVVVRGRFLSSTEAGLSLSVQSVEVRRGGVLGWKGETVVIPREFVWSVEERQVARGKAALLASASLAGFLLAYQAFGPGSSGGPASATGPPSNRQ